MRTILRDNYIPEMGAYHETLVIDDARHKKYLFDCDGVFTDVTAPLVVSERGDSEEFAASQKWVTDEVKALESKDAEQDLALANETAERKAEDKDIWDEIEEIEMASDVVDIVGTYADLQNYDTSHLHDKDLIKVLSDETHDGVIAYYRWNSSTSTFSYVGSEGPYYTESQIDTMMATKQDNLVAGTNIQIASDGVTISATDTTYTAGDNIYISAQNVISTPNNYALYTLRSITPGTYNNGVLINYDGNRVFGATIYNEIFINHRMVILEGEIGSFYIVTKVGDVDDGYRYIYFSQGGKFFEAKISDFPTNPDELSITNAQEALTAGSNITITGNTISATDTTYSPFTGATSSVGGTSGLVPAPTTADVDKVLKGDGTWGDAGAKIITFYVAEGTSPDALVYKDSAKTIAATGSDIVAALGEGTVLLDYGNDKVLNIIEYYSPALTEAQFWTLDAENKRIKGLISPDVDSTPFYYANYDLQTALAAGSNISIVNNTISATGIPALYTTTGQNIDGAVTQKLFTDTVGDIEAALQILNSGAGVP